MKRILAVVLVCLGITGVGQSLRFWGSWDMTLELMPTLRIYESNLNLNCSFLPGWRVESETKIYSGGVYKYQNFYISGSFGDFSVWGKIYFHAQEVRYQKMWVNAEIPVGGGKFRASFNHWARRTDYSSSDEEMFGPWPCYVLVPAAPVIEAQELVDTWQGPNDPRIDQLYYVHGTIVAYYPTSPTTYLNLYLVANYPNKRFIIYINFAAFEPDITLADVLARLGVETLPEVVGKEVCVYGTLVNYTSPAGVYNPEIVLANSPHGLFDLKTGACEPEMQLVPSEGPYINWRYRYTLDPWTITVDFSDCCEGTWFRQLEVKLARQPLCCGLFWDATLTFTKKEGLTKLALNLGDLSLCCGITASLSLELTPTSKKVELKPSWRGLSGCFTVYGDVNYSANAIRGIEVYGFSITCYTDSFKLRAITAFDPDKVEDLTDVTFYTGEFEYLSMEYAAAGCCGGSLTFQTQFWFGNQGKLFGLQRFRFDFSVPLTSNIEFFSKAQWNLAQASPLQWFDIGWEVSF
ncbi:hypothetical protein H5T56_01775 [Candidatus Bipolaricaulota bacterium]|nr:hypothetical protein [Candidatus Bipolaricaulota bacterium]